MKLFPTLIAVFLLNTSMEAQLTRNFDLRGQEAVATSYKATPKSLRATLPNAQGFKAESFAFIRGDVQNQTLVFVCKVTSTEVVFTSMDVGKDFPVKFNPGEKVIACPITDDNYIRRFNVDHRGLCDQCRSQSTAAL